MKKSEGSPQVQFIKCKLELGLTLVQLGHAERKSGDTEAALQATARARTVLGDAQHFLGLIKMSATMRTELNRKLEYLRLLIDTF